MTDKPDTEQLIEQIEAWITKKHTYAYHENQRSLGLVLDALEGQLAALKAEYNEYAELHGGDSTAKYSKPARQIRSMAKALGVV